MMGKSSRGLERFVLTGSKDPVSLDSGLSSGSGEDLEGSKCLVLRIEVW